MDKTKKTKGIYEAIAKFQYEAPILLKNTEGYGYKYVDITEISKTITPLLKKHDLLVMQPLSGTGIKTIIVHWPTSEQIEEYAEIPQDINLKGMNPFQAMGAGITYWRRYALCSYFGLVADKDIDLSGESKPKLSGDKFKDALKAIENAAYSVDELHKNFSLTASQLKQLP